MNTLASPAWDLPAWYTSAAEGWAVEKVKNHFYSQKVMNTDRGEQTILSLTLRGVVVNNPESPEGLVPKDYGTYQLFEVDDLVFKLIDLENVQTSRVGHVRRRGAMSPAYLRLRPRDGMSSRFAFWQFTDLYNRRVFNQLGGGVRATMSMNELLNLPMLVPPYDVQEAIARYLDHAELRIARAIAGKTDLLTKLLEMRRAKVAAGILGSGAGVRFHDGLPFEAPSSWAIEPFWAVAPEVSVSGHAEKELLSVYLDRGVIRYSESGGQVHKPSLDLSAYQLVRPHDLVLNNQQAWRGSVGVSRHEGIISPAYVVCRLDDRFDTDFANLLFRSPVMVSQFELASRGVGSIQRQLHRPSLRVLRVPIPPRSEQGRIASQLISETRGIDAAAESLREEIALLKEYRTRLISDVVTGKIDVRKEAAKLPDIDPAELAAVLAGGAAGADEEEVADGDD